MKKHLKAISAVDQECSDHHSQFGPSKPSRQIQVAMPNSDSNVQDTCVPHSKVNGIHTDELQRITYLLAIAKCLYSIRTSDRQEITTNLDNLLTQDL